MVPVGLLAAPGGVRIEQRDKGSISFTWEHPFSLHGVPITGYWFYYTKNNGRAKKIELLGNSTTYKFSVADPSPCDSYMFQVSAVNAGGEGSLSIPIETQFHDCKLYIYTATRCVYKTWHNTSTHTRLIIIIQPCSFLIQIHVL